MGFSRYRFYITVLALSSVFILKHEVHADTIAWTNDTSDNRLSNTDNWSTFTVPTPTDITTFSDSAIPPYQPFVPVGGPGFDVLEVTFLDATPYVFTITSATTFDLRGVGVTNAGTGIKTFNVSAGGVLTFHNSASGDSAGTGSLLYSAISGSSVIFNDSSNASNSIYDFNKANLIFNNTSSAGAAVITSNSLPAIQFNDSSTAAASFITILFGGTLSFDSAAKGGSATISAVSSRVTFTDTADAENANIKLTSNSNLDFFLTSTAGSSTIDLIASEVAFHDDATAGSATITAKASSYIDFDNNATAGTANITANASKIDFHASSHGGNAIITLEESASILMDGSASLENATVTVNQSRIELAESSTLGNATIQLNPQSALTFYDTTQAGTAQVTAERATVRFNDASLAEAATFTLNNLSSLDFIEATHANTATIDASNSSVSFYDTAQADAAHISLSNSATLDFFIDAKANTSTLTATDSHINFSDDTSADTATMVINDSKLYFIDEATAADANITLNLGSYCTFDDNSTAGSATITSAASNIIMDKLATTGTSTINLTDGSILSAGGNISTYAGSITANASTVFITSSLISGTSTLNLLNGGTIIIAGSGASFGTFSSASASDTINIVNSDLAVGLDNSSTSIAGVISDFGTLNSSSSLTKAGSGSLTLLNPANIYAFRTLVAGGSLIAGGINTLSPNSTITLVGDGVTDGILDLNNFDNTIKSLNGLTPALPGKVLLGTATLTLGDGETTTFYGAITGTTGGLTKQGPGFFTMAGTGSNYTGPTQIHAGTLQAGIAGALAPLSAVTLGNGSTGRGTLDLASFDNTIGSLADSAGTPGSVLLGTAALTLGGDNTSTTFHGIISGAGGLDKVGSGAFTLLGSNTYTGGTTIGGGSIIGTTSSLQGDFLNNGSLVFNQSRTGSFEGDISGTGSLAVMGGGMVGFTGTNSYTGGTSVAAATLGGNTASLQGTITNSGVLKFYQTENGTFNGRLLGNGTVVKEGLYDLVYTSGTSDVAAFAGTTTVNEGSLVLNTALGGSVTVALEGIISGTGTIASNLAVIKGGTIAPGNSIGTLHIMGNYTQGQNTLYEVQVDGLGHSSLIDVAGTATLSGGEVHVTSVDGLYAFNTPYTILHADNGLSGQFSVAEGITSNVSFPLINSLLSYDSQNAYFTLATQIVNGTFGNLTCEQEEIAQQLDAITTFTPDLLFVVNALTTRGLTASQVAQAIDQMSGQQYASAMLTTEIVNRQFLRRLYDPVRQLVTTLPDYSCRDDCCPDPVEFWLEGGATHSSLHSHHDDCDGACDGSGFKMNGYEITGGAQTNLLDCCLTLGAAFGYSKDSVDYSLGGSGTNNTLFGGAYTLFRPQGYYIMTDAAVGFSDNKVNRHIRFANLNRTATGTPKVWQGTLYGEVGGDLPLLCVLVQPFLGVELSYAHRGRIREHGADAIDLNISRQAAGNVDGRIGVHVTSNALPWCLSGSLDLAWQFPIVDSRHSLRANFQSFGTAHSIKGKSNALSSLEIAATIATTIVDNWRIFAEISGERWHNASTYSVLGGIETSW